MKFKFHLWLAVFCLMPCCIGCGDKSSSGNGSSTEAENALAMVIHDRRGVALENAHVTLCIEKAWCSNPIKEGWSNANGSVLIENIPTGTYKLGIEFDTVVQSMELSIGTGTTNLGTIQLTNDGILVPISDWIGSWTYQSPDTNTVEESIETNAYAFLFHEDSSLTYWEYQWKIGYGSNNLNYAPSETLYVKATWSDFGSVKDLFFPKDSVFDQINTEAPNLGLGNAHVILTPVVENQRNQKWTSGFVFSFHGDSISLIGDVKVFTGSSTELSGSTWTSVSDNGDLVSDVLHFQLNENGTAQLQYDDIAYSDGTWSISENGKFILNWNSGASTLTGFYAIQFGRLLIMDLDDPSIFYKEQ